MRALSIDLTGKQYGDYTVTHYLGHERWLLRCAICGCENVATGTNMRAGTARQRCPKCAKPKLTPRETEIAKLVAEGLKNAVIAQRLVISKQSVARSLSRVYGKFNIQNRAQLAVMITKEQR